MRERNLTVEHFVKVEPVHADDALAASEGDKTILGETAAADEQAAGPSRLLIDLAVEGVQLCDTGRLAVPFCLDEIDFASELEAAVDLFAA